MPLEHALQTRGLFPDLGPWKTTPVRQATLNQPLGMDALPRQKYNKAKRAPFQLNLMVVGETGLGKSTFMNTLFHSDLYEFEAKVPQDTKTVEITPVTYELEEGGVTLRLCVIDTPGFGDRLNRNADLEPILTYIDEQYDRFHEAEKNANFRGALVDNRVHACLYFIAPTGHRLKELDIMSLRAISAKVNVIPVIAKADTLTPEEKIMFKDAVLEDLQEHQIKMYPTAFPDDRDEIDELEKHIPFTVIGSTSYVDVNGKQVRGRQYRWGAVEVENPEHCDFIHLRELLMTHCLHELTDLTHNHHYHTHRARRLRGHDRPESLLMCDEEYDTRVDGMKTDLVQEMLSKEEDMRQQFVQKVRETENVLKQREETLQQKRQELMKELEEQKKQLETTERELNDMRNATIRRK